MDERSWHQRQLTEAALTEQEREYHRDMLCRLDSEKSHRVIKREIRIHSAIRWLLFLAGLLILIGSILLIFAVKL